MSGLARVAHAAEYLDEPVHDPAELESGLDDVAAVNRWLGGTRAVIRRLPELLPSERPARILDVGTGSADLPRSIVRWARRSGRVLEVVATDLHPQTLEVARRRSAAFPEITLEAADVLDLPYADGTFDLALVTLVLHHLQDENQVRCLRELARVARRVLVNELERCWPNYLGARVLAATVWRRNRLTRHDGPLSVLRAFTVDELREIAARAGLRPTVYRHFFHRLVLVAS